MNFIRKTFLFLILVLIGCDKKEQPVFIDPAFSEFIATYTAGVVQSSSTIRITLAKDVADSTMIGQEASSKLFEFTPSLKGKAFWLDAKTIEFRPEQRMPSGQEYKVTFLLSRLFKVEKNLSEFEYLFQVMPQNFDLVFDNVKPYVKTELARQRIEGGIITADFAEKENVEKVLAAKQEGRALKISWIHNNDGRVHSFVIEEVARKEQASSVNVAVDGSVIGVKKQLEQEVEIPSLSDFKLMSAKVVQNPNQYVVLQFSDPLKEKQNLIGLVTIADDPNMTLEFDIHDNEIWVYPPVRQTGTKTIRIEPGVRNVKEYRMAKASTADVEFEQVKPQVRFTANGNILPSTDGLVLPFEAVNLRSIDVSISQVFESNILQFMQVNDISGTYEMKRVGRPLLTKTITLDNTGITDIGKWNRFTLGLTTLINAAPGNIYSVKINFKKEYAAYLCDDAEDEAVEEDESGWYEGEEGGYDDDYYYVPGYRWDERDNPCHVSYYTRDRQITKNVLASDLGLMAKEGSDGGLIIFANDLKSTKPLSGIELEFYDFQQQQLGIVTTDKDGKAVFQGKERPFAVIAKNGAMRGYLRLNDGESLSMSGFDVSGEYVNKGLKGFLYGERGVWRPGDSLFLNFILEDKSKTLPATHPVVFELQNPQGVVTNRQVRSSSENGFYYFGTATSPDAATGNWLARVKVGGTDFTQNIKIETVKPNRLKINLDLGVERIIKPDVTANLAVKWLHGAPGKNLKAEFEYSVYSAGTSFKNYDGYVFEDVTREGYTQTTSAFEGQTDAEGKAIFSLNLKTAVPDPPGFMNVVFKGKVFEESGNFSVDRFSLPYSPYSTYVGFQYRDREKYTGMLYTNTDQHVDIVTLDADGKPVSSNLEVKLYSLERYWWWDNYNSNLTNYIEQNASSLVKSQNISTTSGKGSFTFKVEEADWGTYYLKVTDLNGGHVAASTFYIDMPGYYGRSSREAKTGATKLAFNTDKKAYSVGEKVKVNIPGSEGGRALVSIENGRKVLSATWIETTKGENTYQFEATPEMAPNVFVHVSLLQPHAQTSNDLPIRLYGVVPIGVEDAKTHLEPIITMPNELEPGGEVKITVSEKSKRKMTYTLAVVDEGLLDLTRFQTPDPWNRFYAREALGVKTWDLYDRVMGAFGGNLERLLALGGSDAMMKAANDPQANRFKAVVKFFGPITVDGGDVSTLTFKMPQYVGSVKTMLVAGYEGAYGKAEKVTPVRKPLMVLATLPRVVGPTEKVKLPVTLFASDKKITRVKVDIKAEGPLVVLESSKTIDMPASGDITVDFDLDVKPEVGIGKIKVTASSGAFVGTDEIEIDVRNPNPPVSQVRDQIVEAGKSWEPEIIPIGMNGTNGATLEVSSIPPINLGYRLKYLIEYPHGCIEQTTSAVFPQLYLDVVRPLTDREKSNIKNNITKGIERLKLFVTSSGGFGYWPGYNDADEWGSTYAGHFLLEAEAKGYYVPGEMIKRWKKYQKNRANEWRNNSQYNYWDYIQAYRLYTLAFAGAPELPAMNRLRESKTLTVQSAWMLAAAYAKAGQPEVAKKMVAQLTTDIKPYQEMYYSYGSDMRDKAMIMETLTLLNERPKALSLLKDLSKAMSDQGYWMSTQTTAFCLKAIGNFIGSEKRGEVKFSYSFAGKDINASTDLPIAQATLPITNLKPGKLKFTNQSGGVLYVRVLLTGTPAAGLEKDESNDLFVATSYTDSKGNAIDPARLEQGTEFFARVTVKHMGYRSEYRNMALTQIFPSGWEINNTRITGDENLDNFDRGDYQDIRDDRMYTYFSLYAGQTRTFTVRLTASYAGQFYLPAVSCEAMYDNSIYGRTKGMRVEVVKAVGL
jgi:uncharacterized protein YfaS (alpha-2-macroglobulin family)